MMKILLPILILITIGLIIGIIFFIKDVKKNYDKENTGANIVSLFFPIVGFIIYAVNIGKNNKIAKSCIRMALLGMMCGVTIFLMTRCTLILIEGVHTEYNAKLIKLNKPNKDSETKEKESQYLTKEDIEDILKSNSDITKSNVEQNGRSVLIFATFNDDVSEQEMKEFIKNIFKKTIDKELDYNLYMTIDKTLYAGHYSNSLGYVVWAQNNGDN